MVDLSNQPVSSVKWVNRAKLYANDYNPNNVAPPELDLLRVSILTDGWALPLVVRPDGEIVDGFHRWTISAEPEIFAMTGGLVPVVYLRPSLDRKSQMMSTVRFNRSRGVHAVINMADIVNELIDVHGMSQADIVKLMGMENEEVVRLYERGNVKKTGQVRKGEVTGEFSQSWTPNKKFKK